MKTKLFMLCISVALGATLAAHTPSAAGDTGSPSGNLNPTIYAPPAAANTDSRGSDLNPTLLVNKSHSLQPRTYTPSSLIVPAVSLAEPVHNPEMQLTPAATTALEALFESAQSGGITLVLSSGYRSYSDQALLYVDAVKSSGLAAAEAVAPPGYSEHQTGLAADVILPNYFCAAQGCFALSQAAAWLANNAYRSGFVVRYSLHKEFSTGYEYEPWHLRYLGPGLAKVLHNKQETLEEFYGFD